MPDHEIAEVIAVDRLQDSSLTLEERKQDILRTLGEPCCVVQASYQLRLAEPMNLDEAIAQLHAKGLRLGQSDKTLPASRLSSCPTLGTTEFIVVRSGERHVAAMVDCWELSVPVVIELFYIRSPLERLSHLVGERIEILPSQSSI